MMSTSLLSPASSGESVANVVPVDMRASHAKLAEDEPGWPCRRFYSTDTSQSMLSAGSSCVVELRFGFGSNVS